MEKACSLSVEPRVSDREFCALSLRGCEEALKTGSHGLCAAYNEYKPSLLFEFTDQSVDHISHTSQDIWSPPLRKLLPHLHPTHNLHTMEAGNVPYTPNMDELDRKNVRQDGTSQQDVKTLGGAMQVSTVNSLS